MRIAFFSQRVPYPPDRGDKITTFNEVRHLAQHHDVEVFCLADGAQDLVYANSLKPIVSAVHVARVSHLQAALRAASALVTRRPVTVSYHRENLLQRAFDRAHTAKPFDVVLTYCSTMAQYLERYGSLPKVMQFADLDSLKWGQYAERSRWPVSWLYARESRLLLEYERRVAYTFGHALVCTEQELADAQRLIPGAQISCVANGVDLDYFRRVPDAQRISGNLVFTGVMDYWPNVDAVTWFVEEIFPLIRDMAPEATFTICGARPNAQVRSLAGCPGVEVTGPVPDVRPLLARAEICVVPVRLARGIQNKLLEAMAMALPCVTTRRAAGGLISEVRPALRLVDDAKQFALSVVELLRDREAAAALGQQAREMVVAHYRWEHQLAILEGILAARAARA